MHLQLEGSIVYNGNLALNYFIVLEDNWWNFELIILIVVSEMIHFVTIIRRKIKAVGIFCDLCFGSWSVIIQWNIANLHS